MRQAVFTLLAAALSLQVFAQEIISIGPDIEFDAIHNISAITGSWSSGSQRVLTGTEAGFCNPVDSTFTYPQTAGIGYAFSDDGYFEEALYRFTGNGSDPRCIIGVMQWQHGRYELLANGSIVLLPFAQDGRQQVQDPCAAESNVLRQINVTTLFLHWRIFRDPQRRDKLHLFRFDGAPLSPMFRVSETPNMLPTRTLTNTTIGAQASRKRSLAEQQDLPKRNAATRPAIAVGVSAAGLLFAGLLSTL
ncbi:related to ROT1-protein that may be involved in cell wall function [Serendipita indica DSM 11827]|uniref:Protein ROT1 n=1 Tax=Serendipita indica (strain DSM 11827) TaxID=1109443 RepID=G4TUJ6_SERID|nr:related to ROT1-protein that may be involved in cell wall function [Serendipita indica DSM 11827]